MYSEKTSKEGDTMITLTRDFATYDVVDRAGRIEVKVNYTGDVRQSNKCQAFNDAEKTYDWIDKNEKVCRIIQIMQKHTTEMDMEECTYSGNPGISEDVYDEVANELIKELGL